MAIDWRILVAGGAVAGMGLGGFAVAQNSSDPGSPDGIELVSTDETGTATPSVSPSTPIRISPNHTVDNSANSPVKRVVADPESAQSAQSAQSVRSVQSVKSPKSPRSVQSPRSPKSPKSPKSPQSPQSPQSAQSADSAD